MSQLPDKLPFILLLLGGLLLIVTLLPELSPLFATITGRSKTIHLSSLLRLMLIVGGIVSLAAGVITLQAQDADDSGFPSTPVAPASTSTPTATGESTCTQPTITFLTQNPSVSVGGTVLIEAATSGDYESFEWEASAGGTMAEATADSVELTATDETDSVDVTLTLSSPGCNAVSETIAVLVLMPTLAPTVKPSDTPVPTTTPTRTPSATPTPDETAVFETTATANAAATQTQATIAQETAVAVANATRMAANATVIAAPPVTLVKYENRGGNVVYFEWSWPGTLSEHMHYALRLSPENDVPHSYTWTRKTSYELSVGPEHDFPPGNYLWEVVVVIDDYPYTDTGDDGSWTKVIESSIQPFVVSPVKPTVPACVFGCP